MESTTIFFEKILGIKQPWHITKVSHDDQNARVDLYVAHDKGLRFPCPICNEFCSVYDHAPEREFRHLNVFNYQTFIHVRIPRVNCPRDGVQQIEHGLAESNGTVTYEFERMLIDLEQECSIGSVSRLLNVDWHLCQRIQERAVHRGKEAKGMQLPKHIGVDEKSFARGHKYETLIYDAEQGTVEGVVDKRDQKSLETYFERFSFKMRERVETISMDMWDPYIAATKALIPDAAKKIVFDRYHVTRIVTQAVDKVRKQEHRILMEQEIDVLKGTKYLWLWNEENIPDFRREEFEQLRSLDLNVCRARAIKDNLRNLWNYKSIGWIERFFNRWYFWATHSRLKPIISAAKTLKSHIDNILTYAKHKVTNAVGESINCKIEKMKRLACGFRNRNHYRTAILFHCGGLQLYPKRKDISMQILPA
ncbi:ISL3 family transposase [candidate division KSB1 bacterium]|nr:ISL3 family transposase [candidate division KSB1 bacterium]